MKQNTEQEKQTPAPKRKMSDFRKAMMWTAISVAALGIISLFLVWSLGIAMRALFGFGAGLVAAIIAAIVFNAKGKRQIARGIWAGAGIAGGITILALGITCFVILATL